VLPPQFTLGELSWRKSTYSMNAGDCVEVAPENGSIFVRDSKNLNESALVYSAATWRAFVAKTKTENRTLKYRVSQY
jgi:Domain of unknown function (DUF397)